jgi:hypothetical protein
MFARTAPIAIALGIIVIQSTEASAEDAPLTATQIVAAADRVKNPQQPFRVSLSLVEYIHGAQHDVTGFAVHAKMAPGASQYKNLASYIGPPRDVGKLVLMNGDNMWFYDPASKASIRISPQQRLTGQASDGDVLTVNLAHDYDANILGEETIQDADHAAKNVWHLDLKASTSEAMYSHFEYWVEKNTFHPVKAKFFSDSGRVLKIAYYRKYEVQLGEERPTETIIIDAVDTNLVTKIAASDFRAEAVEDAWFQREYLPRFKEQ